MRPRRTLLQEVQHRLPEVGELWELLGEPLGSGGYGTAYRCRRKSDGHKFCAKVILLDGQSSRSQRERVRREVNNLVRARNEAIEDARRFAASASTAAGASPSCAITSAPDGAHYIARCESTYTSHCGRMAVIISELARGPSLATFIREQLFDLAPLLEQRERLARMVCRQMLLALAFLERHGIVHGDVKPGNVVLTKCVTKDNVEQIEIRLVDFGLSKDLERDGNTVSAAYGTPAYIPPERLVEGIGTPNTFKSDVWSISHVAYEMVLGEKIEEALRIPTRHSANKNARFHFTEEMLDVLPFEMRWPPRRRGTATGGPPPQADVGGTASPRPTTALPRRLTGEEEPEGAAVCRSRRAVAVSNEFRDFVERTRACESVMGERGVQFDLSQRLSISEALGHPFIAPFFTDFRFVEVGRPTMVGVMPSTAGATGGLDVDNNAPMTQLNV